MQVLVDYQDRRIRLTDERLAHILKHPEMASMEAELNRTLKSPEIVRLSKSDAEIALYYRFYTDTRVGDKWLCVVVKFLVEDAFILTAYFTDKPKQGGPFYESTSQDLV